MMTLSLTSIANASTTEEISIAPLTIDAKGSFLNIDSFSVKAGNKVTIDDLIKSITNNELYFNYTEKYEYINTITNTQVKSPPTETATPINDSIKLNEGLLKQYVKFSPTVEEINEKLAIPGEIVEVTATITTEDLKGVVVASLIPSTKELTINNVPCERIGTPDEGTIKFDMTNVEGKFNITVESKDKPYIKLKDSHAELPVNWKGSIADYLFDLIEETGGNFNGEFITNYHKVVTNNVVIEIPEIDFTKPSATSYVIPYTFTDDYFTSETKHLYLDIIKSGPFLNVQKSATVYVGDKVDEAYLRGLILTAYVEPDIVTNTVDISPKSVTTDKARTVTITYTLMDKEGKSVIQGTGGQPIQETVELIIKEKPSTSSTTTTYVPTITTGDPFVYIGQNTTSTPSTSTQNTTSTPTSSTIPTPGIKDAVISAKNTNIKVGEKFNFMKNVSAKDDGGKGATITNKVTAKGTVNTKKAGSYSITYSVTGANGNKVSKTVTLYVK